MKISKTFHISAKKHAIKNAQDLARISKHNLRQFKSRRQDDYIEQLLLCNSIYKAIKKIYKEEFDEVVKEHDAKQKRKDRKIKNYFQKVCDSRNDVAVEIIFQLGDQEFWSTKTLEEKKSMRGYFEEQLNLFQQIFPNFKIASASIHYNEYENGKLGAPHMHLVGVPVVETPNKALKKQVIKSEVFTKSSLEEAQDILHFHAEKYMKNNKLFEGCEFKQKEKGRNRDYSKSELAMYKRLEKQILKENKEEIIKKAKEELKEEYKNNSEEYKTIKKGISEGNKELLSIKANISTQKAKESKLNANIKELEHKYEQMKNNPPKNTDYKELYENERKISEKYRLERDEEYNLRVELEEQLEELT